MVFQREVEARLQAQPVIGNLAPKLGVKLQEVFTPSGVATRNVSGPILFKYCRVLYKEEAKTLEVMKGEVVGPSVPMRKMELPKDLKCEGDASSDEDDDEGHIDDDDVDNDDGQVPDVVLADDIIPGLCSAF